MQIWSSYEEPKIEKPEDEPQERQVTYRNVVVTEVSDDLKFYAQNVDNGMPSLFLRALRFHGIDAIFQVVLSMVPVTNFSFKNRLVHC